MAEKLLTVLTLLAVGYLIGIVLAMRMDAYEKKCAELVDKGEIDFIIGRIRENQEEDMRYFGGKSKIAKDISNYINNLMEGNLCNTLVESNESQNKSQSSLTHTHTLR